MSRELEVLQLLVTEQEARASLEATEWDFLGAVAHQSERLRQKAAVRSGRKDEDAAFAALSLTDWDIKSSAQVLLLRDSLDDLSLPAAAAALRETQGVLPEALLIVKLIAEIHKDHEDQRINEAFAGKLLRYADSVSSARWDKKMSCKSATKIYSDRYIDNIDNIDLLKDILKVILVMENMSQKCGREADGSDPARVPLRSPADLCRGGDRFLFLFFFAVRRVAGARAKQPHAHC